jgi:hypothetical protein
VFAAPQANGTNDFQLTADEPTSCLFSGRHDPGGVAMTDFLPKDLREQLASAHRHARRKAATRVVHVGDEAFPILEYSDTGFAVDAEDAAHLRGLIDIYEGVTHLTQALIVASARDGDLMRYEFKRNTRASGAAPSDFVRDTPEATHLLPRA